jgi:undecaprenol kinase/diacylglycerol kinase (ATP)
MSNFINTILLDRNKHIMNSRRAEINNRNTDGQGSFIKSAGFAIQGIKQFFTSERNGRIQAIMAAAVFLAGLLFSISMMEWLIIILFTALVLSLEMFNSALEKLCDKVNPEMDPQIKVIKDMAAGAVLWTSLLAAVAGLYIFIPKIIELL